ncbi:uncharacterized protein LOC100115425 isoform X2 [Nasonia vitripennis]|uniref:ubiquitinyl hydrolase 1 n=1 Tax=Nasonia vitripennis TaxID=7425 RepID=A0A7M7QWI9_NASVI|nr:uncharacterized protein LOC100115425 isoform X2 [Nasonia vitripennis]XP_032453820.1 uncharacterized protein LOC100115425 isoform X2 [Nasonia vitripennis]
MDSQESPLEGGGISMISDLPDTPDNSEVPESTGLSPLTLSLDHNLTLQEDNLSSNDSRMGIENTWTEANTSASDYAIPLQPPFSDLVTDPLHDPRNGIEHGPFLPASATELNNLFSDTGDTPDDSIIVTAPAGVCGLRNLGNTCFMAAGLQCLTATPPVLRHFLELQQRGEKLPPPGSLMANFSTLLSKMWSGKYNVLQPTEFKQTLGVYHSQFKDYRQHDCQEFLALLLDSLHEQMNIAKTNKGCHIPTATATTASAVNSNQNGDSCLGATFTATSDSDLMDALIMDNPATPDGPNSPNVTMAGSPRDSSMDDLDSTANSPHSSPLNDDEETLDSDEIADPKSSFIHNDMQELLNCEMHLDKFNDIAKDAKTSNANFLVTPQECNNEIHYDSQKFPKENSRRIILENANLTENHDFDNKSVSIKRIKEVNCQRSNCSPECGVSSGSETEYDSGLEKCNVKRMRLEDQEKNHRKDGLGASSLQCSRTLQCHENGAVASQDEVEADKHWAKHLRANRSVIVDTFQGQFKSTVVCAVCKHVSVTYEPFMYLSVPLPHAMERQLTITYIPSNGEPPVRCVVSLNKQSRVSKLKEELLKILDKEDVSTSSIALAEVFENHIAKILEDNQLLRCVNDINRSIYAFELTDPPESWVENDTPPASDRSVDPSQSGASGTVPSNTSTEETCTICLEENDGDLKKHCENNCKLVICDPCIETYFKSEKEKKCPVCTAEMTAAYFVKIDQTQRARPAIRILHVPLVMRHDTNEATNNRKGTKLFGHPHLFKLPSRVDAKDVWNIVRRVVPQDSEFTLHFVDGQGHHCSRCMFGSHCTGCKVPESGKVNLQNGDNLAVRYVENVPKVQQPIDHISVSRQRPHHPLSLYDCIQAFSQSETLDEHNPWYCPKCERNQCATKTLTVHRYPKFLIVYLKRFVFYECVSMKLDDKVTFPLCGLNCGKHLYDLYACVCHFGGVSAGHYTAYAKNPQTDIWHYYNDDVTSRQKPQEEDFSNAYILFYSRQGASVKQCNI